MDWGSKLGKIVGKAKVLYEETSQYKGEYEYMSNSQLENEFKNVEKSCFGTEKNLRKTAIKLVLQERGYDLSRL